MSRVLVTGATGLLGPYLVDAGRGTADTTVRLGGRFHLGHRLADQFRRDLPRHLTARQSIGRPAWVLRLSRLVK